MTKHVLISTQEFPIEISFSEIQTETLVFRPVEMKEFLRLRGIAGKLISALSDMLSSQTSIPKQSIDIRKDPLTGQEIQHKVETDSISAEDVSATSEKRKRAIQNLLDIFLEESNHTLACRLVANSLRDEGYTAEDIKASDVQIFMQLMVGFLESNIGVILPLTTRLGNLIPQAQEVDEEPEVKEESHGLSLVSSERKMDGQI